MPKAILCDPSLFSKDLTGQHVIVTGSNTGIGRTTAEQLLKQGATVVLACRTASKGQHVLDNLPFECTTGVVMELDLGNFTSIRNFAVQYQETFSALHLLINNAGVMNTPKGQTADGLETQIGVNHFGHFLLTELLLPLLLNSAPARIINVSSCYHDVAVGRKGKIHFDDMHFERHKYDGWRAYAQSKLANVLHAKHLAEKLKDQNVSAFSLHPGWVRTELIRHTLPLWVQDYLIRPLGSMVGLIEPWEGSQTTLHCALADSLVQHSGAFFSQLGMYRDKKANAGGWPMPSPNPCAHDSVQAAKLYERSLQTVGLERSNLPS